DQIFSDGEAIGRSRWLGIPIRFIRLLKQLSVTRHEAEAQRMLSEIEEAARRELPEDDYLTVYFSSHDLPDEPRACAPGTVCRKRLGGRQVKLVWPALQKRIEDPESWHDDVLKLIRDRKTDAERRIVFISLLGEESE